MDKIVEEAISKIQELERHIPNGKHVVTGDIRKLRRRSGIWSSCISGSTTAMSLIPAAR